MGPFATFLSLYNVSPGYIGRSDKKQAILCIIVKKVSVVGKYLHALSLAVESLFLVTFLFLLYVCVCLLAVHIGHNRTSCFAG